MSVSYTPAGRGLLLRYILLSPIFEPIVTVTTRPDRRELTHDRLLAQSAVITADSTGESGVAGRELLANQNIRNEGVVITRESSSCLSQSIQVTCF